MTETPTQPVFSEERRRKILDLVSHQQKVTVQELADRFGVSSATIRSDLRDLDERKLLTRTHGGAITYTKLVTEVPIDLRSMVNMEAKRKIARAALPLIEEGDCIILDTSTTSLELARELPVRQHLTVITNDLVIARLLENAPGIDIILLGGNLRKNYHCTVGPQNIEMLSHLTVDKLFLATDGISLERGLSTTDITQAEVKKAMIRSANEVYLLADRTKLGRVALARFGDLHDLDGWVVESPEGLPLDVLGRQGLRLYFPAN